MFVDINVNQAVPIAPDRLPGMVKDFTATLQAHRASGEVEAAYNLSVQHGLMILDVPTVTDAWRVIQRYALYPHWLVTMAPLVDALEYMDLGRESAQVRAAV